MKNSLSHNKIKHSDLGKDKEKITYDFQSLNEETRKLRKKQRKRTLRVRPGPGRPPLFDSDKRLDVKTQQILVKSQSTSTFPSIKTSVKSDAKSSALGLHSSKRILKGT